MIKSFGDKETEKIADGYFSKRLPPEIQRKAKMQLDKISAATTLDFLRLPPSNRLEALKGARARQWSIRINDQWRICFEWCDGDAYNVEIVDYH